MEWEEKSGLYKDGSEASLEELRAKIRAIDVEMEKLFLVRMELSRSVARYKRANGIAVRDEVRERENREALLAEIEDEALRPLYERFLNEVMAESRAYQTLLNADESAPEAE